MTNFDEKLKEFGIWFSNLRIASGYKSQRQLALESNVSPTTISRIESGAQKAEPDTLAKLAPYVKTSYDELMVKAGYPIKISSKNDTSSTKKPKDLLKILEQEQFTLNGEIITPEDMEVIMTAVEQGYHLAKKLNKRKKE